MLRSEQVAEHAIVVPLADGGVRRVRPRPRGVTGVTRIRERDHGIERDGAEVDDPPARCGDQVEAAEGDIPRPSINGGVAREVKGTPPVGGGGVRSEEHTSELQSLAYLVCRLLLE